MVGNKNIIFYLGDVDRGVFLDEFVGGCLVLRGELFAVAAPGRVELDHQSVVLVDGALEVRISKVQHVRPKNASQSQERTEQTHSEQKNISEI